MDELRPSFLFVGPDQFELTGPVTIQNNPALRRIDKLRLVELVMLGIRAEVVEDVVWVLVFDFRVTIGLNIDLNYDNCGVDITPYVGENMVGDEEHVDKGDCGINDNANVLGMGLTSEDDQNLEPYNGMEFDSHEEAYSFYLKYAKFVGFAVLKKASRWSKISNKLIDVKFSCTRYGTKRESNAINPRPYLKINCQATSHVKRGQDCGKWFVQNFIKEHNHELFPNDAHYFPCHRKITSIDKHNIDTLHIVGVGTSKIFAMMAK
ncbi:hypothetical protein L1049_016353 [Liquidambar formosana]|uniref:WRKY domain-containing protein n=1 Tax=Liquidambar formosana TaxID=63359 RepID=A0AAP0S0J6_LIQFO